MIESKEVMKESRRMIPDEQRCTHVHPDGRRCGNRRWAGREFCWHHDPLVEQERQAEAQENEPSVEEERSGQVMTPRAVHDLLVRTAEALEAGKISTSRAYAVGYLASLLLGSLKHIDSELIGEKGWGEYGTLMGVLQREREGQE
ncbi:MAG: hypothetical protein L0170_16600 [Acidobacteria bacterium]|nr:hypothetical protein [Acidobacteriota bacterium]